MCDWKARGRYTSCEEIRERVQITYTDIRRGLSDKQVLNYLEYVSNIVWLCNERYLCGSDDFDNEYTYLQESVIS